MSVTRINAMINRAGQTVTLRRVAGTTSQTFTDVAAKASVRGYQPHELVGPVQQGDREVTIGVWEMLVAGWPMPPRRNDKAIIDGVTTNVEAAEARHFREDIAFYVLRCRG